MEKNIFVCHRPYHILRCCDMIKRGPSDNYNILYSFDVKLNKKNEFQRFEVNSVLYPYFDEVIELSRVITPSVRSFLQLYRVCKNKRKEYLQYVTMHSDVSNIYFFADDELEVQLLVGLFKEKISKCLNCILVDEGLVTYSHSDHPFSWKRRTWLKLFSIISGIKYFNYDVSYGASNIYNKSLANNVEKAAFFHPPVYQLEPLSEEICSEIRNKINSKKVPDYRRPYFIYADTYEKTFDDDYPIITQMIKVLDGIGVNFYLKLHPQQNEELYSRKFGDSILLEKGIPVELFFGKNAIIGGTISSSLFNASLQGVKTMDISYLFPEDLRNSWGQKPISEQFKWIGIQPIHSFVEFEKNIIEYHNKE